jgi:hypothetical protein
MSLPSFSTSTEPRLASKSPASHVVRLTATTISRYLASQDQRLQPGKRIVVLRAAPVWDGPAEVYWERPVPDHQGSKIPAVQRTALVTAAASPLAVYELALKHLSGDGPSVLVVLTDQEEIDLGESLLGLVYRQRVNMVNTWNVVQQAFGASSIDPRLYAEKWAAEALLDAAPGGGWPRVSGEVLSRDEALTSLALRRLGLGHIAPGRLDIHALLDWSLTPDGPQRLLALRKPEREGLARFLGGDEQTGRAGTALLALVQAEHSDDAVAIGLVCGALWRHADPDAEVYRARGRAERYFGTEPPATGAAFDEMISRFAEACEEFTTTLLIRGNARRQITTVLARAESLAQQFGAHSAAAASPLLPSGLETRFDQAGRAMASGDLNTISDAVSALDRHRLAQQEDTAVRIRRVQMAQRLTQWLASDPATSVHTVTEGIDRHLAETGWVDLALHHIEAGGDGEATLTAAYDALCRRVRDRRRTIDRGFADALTAGNLPGDMLTVETFLHRIVAPVVRGGDRPLLLLVLDGMNAAIAAELGDELREDWAEYDPLPGASDVPQRRAMAAALPTITAVSRTSLFAGELRTGSQRDEKALIGSHRFWGGRQVSVFHKDDLRAESGGDNFGSGLMEALADDGCHVAVVLNTIDDRLASEQKLGDATWRTAEIGKLRDLLQTAAGQGRIVLITSDHGHVVERGSVMLPIEEVISARYRAPGGPLDEREVLLSGPRVFSGPVVALWDSDARYTSLKAGYHGGAALAEVTIPVLALLPFGALPPKGWRELGEVQPSWWSLTRRTPATVSDHQPDAEMPKRTRRVAPKPSPGKASLFELDDLAPPTPAEPAEPVAPHEALVSALLGTETFQDQCLLLGRKPDLVKVEAAVRVLLDAGGTLPVTALAQRINLTVTRADGFAAVLRQLLNFDGVQVLETLPDGRTLRLHTSLLRDQFGL